MGTASTSAIAVILAGGEGRRLGNVPKATVELAGRTLLERVHERLAPQVATILLSVGTRHLDAPWAARSKLSVVADPIPNAGPFGGIAGALVWARAYAPKAATLVSVPVDVPFLPVDLIARLAANGDLAVAQSGDQHHHAIAAWPLSLADEVLAGVGHGEYALHRWQKEHAARAVVWPTTPCDPFLNINTADDLKVATDIARRIA